jgi:hypothetical protein
MIAILFSVVLGLCVLTVIGAVIYKVSKILSPYLPLDNIGDKFLIILAGFLILGLLSTIGYIIGDAIIRNMLK